MYPAERRIQFLHHVAERDRQRRPPAYHYVIVAGT
jgi:hypothetical protein